MMLMEYVEHSNSDIRLKLIKNKLDDVKIITKGARILDRRRYNFDNTNPPKVLQYELFRLGDELHYIMKTVKRQILNEVIDFG